MLKQNWFKTLDDLGSFFLDSEYPENISVLGCHIMVLDRIIEISMLA